MSSPVPTTPPPEPGFDPLVFWIQHRKKVVALAGLLVIGLSIYFIAEFNRTRKLAASARLLAEATDATGWTKVISEYRGTVAAGDAQLLLAGQLRREGKFDEAITALRNLIEECPDHPLLSGAWTSLAATQEAQGKTDEALGSYQKVSTSYATSFSAPVALLAQARIFKAKGKTEEAKRIYDQIIAQYQESSFAQQAARENQQLKK